MNIGKVYLIKATVHSGDCKKCGKYYTAKSKHEWVAHFKFYWWLYWHYKIKHKEDILINIIINSMKIKYR